MVRKFKVLWMAFGAVSLLSFAACGPKYPNCKEDKHCKDKGEFCVDGLCRQCAVDAHCASMGPCAYCGSGYTCQKPAGNLGDCCTSDLNCNGGKCNKAPGMDRGTCVKCLSDADCGPGQACSNNSCVAKAECDANNPCPAGKRCDYGRCVEDTCQMSPVLFDFDQAEIRVDQRPVVTSNYDCIKKRGVARVKLEGNADERGGDQYNMQLGSRRANAAKAYLVRLGMKGKDIQTVSYGEANPVCSSQTEDCWQRNRRVDFVAQ
jgi:outer membrane protein OmpA-like peptidoglycan-associated protein